MKDASKVLSSQVFINCLIMVGSRVLLMAQRKNRQKIRVSARVFFFIVLNVFVGWDDRHVLEMMPTAWTGHSDIFLMYGKSGKFWNP